VIYLYLKVYKKDFGTYITYTGITTNMQKRQQEHEKGVCRTTKRFNKSYILKEIRYIQVADKTEEQKFKRLNLLGKLNLSDNWSRFDLKQRG